MTIQAAKRHEPFPIDDNSVFFPFYERDVILINEKKYTLIKALGAGTNSAVYEAQCEGSLITVAIKINSIGIKEKDRIGNDCERSRKYIEAEYHYLKIFKDKQVRIIKPIDFGTISTKYIFNVDESPQPILMNALVLERLGRSLYALPSSLELKTIKIIGTQILYSLFLMHDLDITHCDIKTLNLLFNTQETSVRIIDLGMARKNIAKLGIQRHIQTRYNRAPEVFLQQPLTTAIDIFSLGCVLGELVTNKILFSGKNFMEQAAYYEQSLGEKIPQKMLENSPKTMKAYTKDFELLYKGTITEPLEQVITKATPHEDKTLRDHFIDLLRKMLSLDPAQRITAAEAHKHPFFQ